MKGFGWRNIWSALTQKGGNTPPTMTEISHSAFPATPWTMVVAVQDANTIGESALAEICQLYWYPLYAYVRRKGYSREDAEDLTQGFFAKLLARQDFAGLDRARGKLRSYLLTALDHHLSSYHRHAKAEKRGGGRAVLSIDFERAEKRYQNEPQESQTPEAMFERRWATTLLESVMRALAAEQVAKGKGEQFAILGRYITFKSGEAPYREVGETLGVSEGNARIMVHRLRQRYGELLKAHVASTVRDPSQVREELHHLMAVFA